MGDAALHTFDHTGEPNLNQDLLHLVGRYVAESQARPAMLALSKTSWVLNDAVKRDLFRKLVCSSTDEVERFVEEAKRMGQYVEHLSIASDTSAARPENTRFWRCFLETLTNVRELIISSPNSVTKPSFPLPPTLHKPWRPDEAVCLPKAQRLVFPLQRAEMLRVLDHAPVLKEVVLPVAQSSAIFSHNLQHATTIIREISWPAFHRLDDLDLHRVSASSRSRSQSQVERLSVGAQLSLRLEEMLEFAGSLFPDLKVLEPWERGSTGHLTSLRPSANLIRHATKLPHLRNLSFGLMPPRDLSEGEEGTSFPSSTRFDHLIQALSTACPRLETVRITSYNCAPADWTVEWKMRWELTAHIRRSSESEAEQEDEEERKVPQSWVESEGELLRLEEMKWRAEFKALPLVEDVLL